MMSSSIILLKQRVVRRTFHSRKLLALIPFLTGLFIISIRKLPHNVHVKFEQVINLQSVELVHNKLNLKIFPTQNITKYINTKELMNSNKSSRSSKKDCLSETRATLLQKMKDIHGENHQYEKNQEVDAYINNQCIYTTSCTPNNLLGRIQVDMGEVGIDSLQKLESLKHLKNGGWWYPHDCSPEKHVAIIIPFKKRESQLAVFLRHYHPIFQRQKLHYRIFVIEQADQHPFNRGKLMNVGFKESLKYFPFDCFVFHDVDLLLEDDRLIYRCQSSPEHLSVGLDKYKYRLLYQELFGGIEMFSKEHYQLVNGFSNSFWGWGAEDDNLYRRLAWKGLSLWRPSVHIARYTMIKHQDLEAQASMSRFDIRKESYKHFKTDGLVNLQYDVKNAREEFSYTHIQVDLRKDKDKLFGVKEFSS